MVRLGLEQEIQVGRGGVLGVFSEVTIVILGGSAVGGSLVALGEGAGQSGWKATGGAGRGDMRV